MAVCDRLDDPMKEVEKPDARSNSQALACMRVLEVSYETFTFAPSSTRASSAFASVEPR